MIYNYFQYYDPDTGRYLTNDPIGLDGGINTYGYAFQNPLRYTDFAGLNPLKIASAICGVLWATEPSRLARIERLIDLHCA